MENMLESDNKKVIEDFSTVPILKKKLNLTLPVENSTVSEFLKNIEEILKFSVRTSHPRFINQIFTGSEPIG